jgi:tyrosinase
LSNLEKTRFTNAVNELKKTGEYDEFVNLHKAAYHKPSPWAGHDDADYHVRNGDQKGPAFLPWHRQQLNLYEAALQRVSNDTTLALPYWNYMKDSMKKNPAKTALWSAQGIGSNGRAEDHKVVDGPFANWPLKYADLGEPTLERNVGHNFPTPGVAEDFLVAFDQTNYDSPPYTAQSKTGFRNFIEGFGKAAVSGQTIPPSSDGAGDMKHGLQHLSLHAAAHAFVGRSMINSTSPNDPAFYMLHAFTDALWMSWQVKQLAKFPRTNVYDHFEPHADGPLNHALHDEMAEMDGVTPYDMIDFNLMDYEYDELPVPSKIMARFNSSSSSA